MKIPSSILVIADDSGRDAQFIKVTLKDMEYKTIHLFEKADEAVDMIESDLGNLLIVNIENQALGGLKCLTQLKGNPKTKHVPVILSLAAAERDLVMGARKAGADGLIIKPLAQKKILDQLKFAVEKSFKEIRKWRKDSEKEILKKDLDLATEQAEKKILYTDGIKRLEALLAAFPWYDEIYVELAKMFMRTGFGARAIPYLQKAGRLNPRSPKTPGLLSDIFAEDGEYVRAIRFAKQAAAISGSARAFSKLGELELKGGNLNDAIKTLGHSLAIIKSEKDADEGKGGGSRELNLRGQAFREKGETEQNKNMMNHAVKDFEASAKINPNFLAAHYNLMVTYKKMGEKQKALEVLDRIKELEPRTADDWIELAEAYFKDGDLPKVKFALERALEQKKGDMHYYKMISEIYVEYGMLEMAEAMLQKVQSADP
ncbi:MAG: response regulator, partial [Nitrospinota bacterium]